MAVITACAVNIKPSKAADEPTASPTILDGATPEYTGQAQKIVTDLPDGMRYFITKEYIDPTTIDAGKIVPTGYTALDYLQSTGTQYIDTGVLASGNTRVVIDWQFNDITKTQQRIFGNITGSDSFNFEIYLNSRFGIAYCYNDYDGNWVNTQVAADTGRHVFDLNGLAKTLQIDNGKTFNSGLSYNTAKNLSDTTIAIYFNRRMNSSDCVARGNAYSCQMYEKGVLQRDFVPVRRDADQTLGMYDLCTGKLYENNGKDKFIPGEAVNTAIKGWKWSDSVDDEQNNVTLQANTKYYVYYYTPNTDTTTVTPLAVKEFYVNCTNHVYGEWQTTTPATCTTEGVREHTCTGCGHTESEVIPATGHDYQIADDVPATCTEAGYTRYECTHCHDDYQTSGAEQKPLGHEYLSKNDKIKQPSCTDVGYTTHICERCQHTYQSDYVPATGHNYGTWTTTEPATTEHAGEQKRTCEHCGAEQVRTIPALAGTTTDGGKDNTAPLLWGIIIGVIAVLAGCGGLAWLLIVLFKPKKKEKVAAA